MSQEAPPSEFAFATCQVGAEGALKGEVARVVPAARLAFSRPGFVTFKWPQDETSAGQTHEPLVFARAFGHALGRAQGDTPDERVSRFWELAANLPATRLHVWQRDTAQSGVRGFTPGPTAAAHEARNTLLAVAPPAVATCIDSNEVAQPGDLVLDCILVDSDVWWAGYHCAQRGPSSLPGGLWSIELPAHAVSRAYLKMSEALRWSRFPLRPGDRWVEIGCAPGGSCQALLDREQEVVGIDPAEVDPAVLAHERFTHIRKRGADVRRRDFRKFHYLAADLNVAPSYTLDTVEEIVTYPEIDIRGLLLTLKLLDWSMADELPAHLDRIRSWGYASVEARQLQYGRQEVCVAALRSRATRTARKRPVATKARTRRSR